MGTWFVPVETLLPIAALRRAVADDFSARVELNAIKALLSFAEAGYRGPLELSVMPDGAVEVSAGPATRRAGSRTTPVYLDDILAARVKAEAKALGL